MWNRTGQSDQEAMGPGSSSQHQSHPAHNSMHPPQPMQQTVAQDKSCGSGKLEHVCIHTRTQTIQAHVHPYVGDRTGRG